MPHGYTATPFTTGGDEPANLVEVDLGPDGWVILTATDHQRIAASAASPAAYRALMLDARIANAEEWRRNRGPDSALGRGIEEGTPPPPDHSSDPS